MSLFGLLVLQADACDWASLRRFPGWGGRSRPISKMALNLVSNFLVVKSSGDTYDDIRRHIVRSEPSVQGLAIERQHAVPSSRDVSPERPITPHRFVGK